MNTDWMLDAACRGMNPDDFHPARGALDKLRAAQQICAGCTVKQHCLTYAMANETRVGEAVGIWGGLSGRQRRKMAEERARTRTHRSPNPRAATPQQRAMAVRMHREGYPRLVIAERMGVNVRSIDRWVAEHREDQGVAS